MNVRWTVLTLVVLTAQGNLVRAQDAVLPPVVGDLNLTSSLFGGIVSGQLPSEGNVEVWSDFQEPFYTPLFPGQRLRVLIPPTFDPATKVFEWDMAGSPGGNYTWAIGGSNSAGSDFGSISVNNILFPDYPVPAVNDLKFIVQSSTSGGGLVEGIVTVDEEPLEWSELLYPTYKPQPNAPGTAPIGIQVPNWNADTQQFSWNMHGAQPGIYSWIVKANNEHGLGAGAIEVQILVPEPSAMALLGVAAVVWALGGQRSAKA
jgi:hypothetical protein